MLGLVLAYKQCRNVWTAVLYHSQNINVYIYIYSRSDIWCWRRSQG